MSKNNIPGIQADFGEGGDEGRHVLGNKSGVDSYQIPTEKSSIVVQYVTQKTVVPRNITGEK